MNLNRVTSFRCRGTSLRRLHERPLATCVVGLTILLCLSLKAWGEAPPLCAVTSPEYKVVTPQLVAVHCNEDVSALTGLALLYDLDSSPTAPIATKLAVTAYPGASQWLIVALNSGASSVSLRTKKKYKLALLIHPPGQNPEPGREAVTVSLDVVNTISVTPALAFGENSQFDFISHIAFQTVPTPLCTLQVEDFLRRIRDLSARCRSNAVIPNPNSISASNVAR
jgi:hypothetical protein